MKLNSLDFDFAKNDFVVNGTPLLLLLKKHDGVQPETHTPSVTAQPGACDRLLGLAEPDLQGGHVAIYLCGHCGGYDGSPIGVKLRFEESCVKWQEIGYHYDYAEQAPQFFQKVTGYSFDREQYVKLIHQLRVCEPSDS